MSPSLTLNLFGGVNLLHNGAPLAAPKSRKALALFLYLACTGRAHSREALADLLWDAASTTQSLSNLRTVLSRLPPPLASHLQITRDAITVAPASAPVVDARELERALVASPAQLSKQSAARLALALENYQGDFLAGFQLKDAPRFDEWAMVERERLRILALESLHRLTNYHLEVGEYEGGIQTATQLLRLEPTDEMGHGHLIRMLAYTGQRAAALAQFETCRQLLQAEYGMEPNAALQALYSQLRDGTLAIPTVNGVNTPAPPHNLPAQLTPLLGRQTETTSLQALLRRPDVRLVTLTGPGGVGKSRLGEAVAWGLLPNFADGVFLIELAAVRDPQLVLSAIAQTLAVRDQDSTPLQQRLHDYLCDKQCLLLVDNFEQVIDAAPRLLELLRACPGVHMLVTSRETLRLRGEQEFPVPTLAPADAVALFTQRAQAVQPTFRLNESTAAIVASICQQLDYLPLAIELAAAQSKLFAPPAILARLKERSAFLISRTRDRPDRQRTLRATLDWSYELLTVEEQRLFRRLAVFRGGRNLAAVETVCNPADDEQVTPLAIDVLHGLTALLEKSLLYQTTDSAGEPRFMMLVTIHEYALAQLGSSTEANAIRQRHLNYCLALAEQAEQELIGANEAIWLDRLETEHDNLSAALHYSLNGEIERGARLGAALRRYWENRGYVGEGRQWLTDILTQNQSISPQTRAKALTAAGNLAWRQSDYAEAVTLYQEGLALRRAHGDKAGLSVSLMHLGNLAQTQGDYGIARSLYEEGIALSREVGDSVNLALLLLNLSLLVYALNEYDLVRVYAEEGLALNRAIGNQWGIAHLIVLFANLAIVQGDFQAANSYFEEALALRRGVHDKRGIAASLDRLGWIKQRQGYYDVAETLYTESLALGKELNEKPLISAVLSSLATLYHDLDNSSAAQALLQESLAIYQSIGNKAGIARTLNSLGWVNQALGNDDAAQVLHEESLALQRTLGEKEGIATALHYLANLARKQDNSPLARSRHRESLLLFCALGDKGWYEQALRDIAPLLLQAEKLVATAQLLAATAAFRTTTGVVIPPRERAAYEQTLAAVRSGLGEAAFAATWATGCAMTLEQAVDNALAELRS